jgi:hypothetical protein
MCQRNVRPCLRSQDRTHPPRKAFSVDDDLLLLVRTEGDRRSPGATLGDLDVRRWLVGASAKVDSISSSSSVHSRLNRAVWEPVPVPDGETYISLLCAVLASAVSIAAKPRIDDLTIAVKV